MRQLPTAEARIKAVIRDTSKPVVDRIVMYINAADKSQSIEPYIYN